MRTDWNIGDENACGTSANTTATKTVKSGGARNGGKLRIVAISARKNATSVTANTPYRLIGAAVLLFDLVRGSAPRGSPGKKREGPSEALRGRQRIESSFKNAASAWFNSVAPRIPRMIGKRPSKRAANNKRQAARLVADLRRPPNDQR